MFFGLFCFARFDEQERVRNARFVRSVSANQSAMHDLHGASPRNKQNGNRLSTPKLSRTSVSNVFSGKIFPPIIASVFPNQFLASFNNHTSNFSTTSRGVDHICPPRFAARASRRARKGFTAPPTHPSKTSISWTKRRILSHWAWMPSLLGDLLLYHVLLRKSLSKEGIHGAASLDITDVDIMDKT